MYTYLADRAFESCRILQHRADIRISGLILALEFFDIFIAVAQVDLRFLSAFRQSFEHAVREITVRDKPFELVDAR